MKRILAACFIVLLLSTSAWAVAGSCVFTKTSYTSTVSYVERVWVCTSDAAGAISAPTITGTDYNETIYTKGYIQWAEIIPGTGGDAPDAITTFKLLPTTDATLDLLGGLGAAASTTNTTAAIPLDSKNAMPMKITGKALTISATGLGNANKVTLKIYTDR